MAAFALILLFVLAGVGVSLWWLRSTQSGSIWKAESYQRPGVYKKQPENQIDVVAFRLRRGTETMHIEPPGDHFGLDPASENFPEELAAYRAHAKSVADSMNVSDKLLD